jgi:hypothetical protein
VFHLRMRMLTISVLITILRTPLVPARPCNAWGCFYCGNSTGKCTHFTTITAEIESEWSFTSILSVRFTTCCCVSPIILLYRFADTLHVTLLGTLLVSWMVQKLPTLHGTRLLVTVCIRASHWISILSRMNKPAFFSLNPF